MKDKYKKYIEYIAKDIELPYIHNMVNQYGLKQDEMNLVLGIVFNQPVHYFEPMHGVYNKDKVSIYHERSDGNWYKQEYDSNGNKIYHETSNGYWCKYEYNTNGNKIYYENSDGYWSKSVYDNNGNKIYHENSRGYTYGNKLLIEYE